MTTNALGKVIAEMRGSVHGFQGAGFCIHASEVLAWADQLAAVRVEGASENEGLREALSIALQHVPIEGEDADRIHVLVKQHCSDYTPQPPAAISGNRQTALEAHKALMAEADDAIAYLSAKNKAVDVKVGGMYPREMCERMAAPNVAELAAELADARRVVGYLNHRVAWWKSQARKHKRAAAVEAGGGWRLVPVEPTEAMIDAALDEGALEGRRAVIATYRAILAAAPPIDCRVGAVDDVIRRSYGFTITEDGELHGLTSGDMGYEDTGIRIDMTGWTATLTQPQGGEVVAWQLRVQYEPKGVPGEWSEWQYCGLAEYEAIKRGEGYYEYRNAEARALYAYSRPHDSRDDTARLDWLLESHANVETDGADNWRVVLEWTNPETYFPYADSRRAAIDAARGQGES